MIAKTVVNRPTTIAIIYALLAALGFYAASRLAIDLLPEVNPPILVVSTTYTGAGPEEVENSVSRPLEAFLSNISGVEKIVSTSNQGSSTVRLDFTWGTDMSEAANDVRDALERAKALLPDGASTPSIFKFDPSMFPILQLAVAGNRPQEELRELAENLIQPRLEQVEGVALVSVSGGREKAVLVEIPQNRLEAYGLNLSQVAAVLRGQNIQVSAGTLTQGDTNYLIQTAGQFVSLEEIRSTVVTAKGNPPVGIRVRDLGNVSYGYKPAEGRVRVNGQDGVIISLQKQSGTNSVATAKNVLDRLKKIEKELPPGIEIRTTSDNTRIIQNSLNNVTDSALQGAILAVVVLFLFLRSFKSSLVIAVAIPIAVVLTMAAMYFFGLTLNVMTLAGLTLGVGMLLDNSIVILENVYRYREKGTKLAPASILGTTEMLTAITASTLTTLVVFAPLVMFQDQLGIVGQIFSGLSFTIVFSLSASLIVAATLVPVLTSHYLPLYTRQQRPLKGWFLKADRKFEEFWKGLDLLYEKALRKVMRHKGRTALIILGAVALSGVAIPFVGLEFLPSMGQDLITVNVELPVGTRLEVTEEILGQLEEIVRSEVKGYENILVNAGGRSNFGLGAANSNSGTLTVTLPPEAQRIDSFKTVQEKLRAHFGDFSGATISFGSAGMGLNSNPVDIIIKSEDLTLAGETALKIRDLLKDLVPEAKEPKADLKQGRPQLNVVINRERASSFGLNIASIGTELRAGIDGVNAGRYSTGGKDDDIVVILDPEDRKEVDDLDRLFVVSPSGQKVAFSSFATREKGSGPVTIQRTDQARTLHVTAGLAPGAKLDQTVEKIQKVIRENIPQDDRVSITYGGDFENLMKYGTQFLIILLISALLVYGVMAAQFESFLDPFIILFTIPLTIIGVVAMYLITGEPFSVFTAAGLVVLVGIVVNNGIVLVDYTNTLRKRGTPLNEAVVIAGGHRLRPILMTTLTTVLGLAPVAFFGGEGSELIQPIAKTLLGGLTASTFLTLFLIPVLYVVFNRISDKRKAAKKALEEAQLLEARAQLEEEGR